MLQGQRLRVLKWWYVVVVTLTLPVKFHQLHYFSYSNFSNPRVSSKKLRVSTIWKKVTWCLGLGFLKTNDTVHSYFMWSHAYMSFEHTLFLPGFTSLWNSQTTKIANGTKKERYRRRSFHFSPHPPTILSVGKKKKGNWTCDWVGSQLFFGQVVGLMET